MKRCNNLVLITSDLTYYQIKRKAVSNLCSKKYDVIAIVKSDRALSKQQVEMYRRDPEKLCSLIEDTTED